MTVKQISVFVENKVGIISDVALLLGENNININTMSLADATDFGILRMIVSDTDLALKILKEQGFAVKCTDVLVLAVDDMPGGLSKVLHMLKEAEIGIEYMYAFLGTSSKGAMVVLRVLDLEGAEELLKAEKTPDVKDVYRA